VQWRRLPLPVLRKLILVALHINATAAEAYTFGFEAEALLEGRVSACLDLSTSAKDAMPWQSTGRAECGGRLTRASR